MWQALPTQADLMRLYPAAARSRGVEGLARVLCQVDAEGLMHDCAVLGVDAFGPDRKPMAQASGLGFEAAALTATRYYQAKPAPGDGSRVWNFEVAFSPRGEGGLWRPIPLTPPSQVIAPPPPDAVVTAPDWLKKPGPADVARVYPAAAAKAGLDGRAVIGCKFTPTGLLRDCAVKSEAPDGAGFGAAALRLAEVFQARPLGRDGDQVGGRPVSIPFIFQRPGATPVSYAAPAPAASVITSPDWARKPEAADVARAYPADDKDELGGTAVIDCRFTGDGRLTGCGVKSETPPGDGFGAAALKLARLFQAKPMSRDGVAVAGGFVRIPIRFQGPHRGPDLPLDGAATVTRPVWTEKPTAADIARLYPPEALKQGLSADVVLNCRVGADGRFAECGVAPPNDLPMPIAMDFGTATLQLAKLFRMQPQSADGAATAGGLIHIPVRWTPPSRPSAAARVTQPVWIEKPTAAELVRFYPAEAVKQNLEGMTTLSCGVDRDGRLNQCTASGITTFGAPEAVREDFRKATLELAGFFRLQTQPPGGRVVIPIRWALPTDRAAKARLDALTG
jgi:TonB family protein